MTPVRVKQARGKRGKYKNDSKNFFLEINAKKTETTFKRYLHSHVHSRNIICKLPKYERNLRVHQWMNGSRSSGKYIQWSIIQP